ncbi:MAG: AEC family transporter [Chitinophagales bacterium]|nr:AEC family transporter [Bacteroidota bacterium]
MEFLNQPIALLFLFFLGFLAQLLPINSKSVYTKINHFILYVPLPAIVLLKIPELTITKEVLFPIASAWIIFIASIFFAYLFCKIFKYDAKTMACIILCCGLGNTSFVGFPFIEHFYGEQNLQYAIFVDQPGSFVILSTIGIIIATSFGSEVLSLKSIVIRLIKFPPFVIFIIALFLPNNFIPQNGKHVLKFVGDWMVPLAILSLGMQFNLSIKHIDWKKLCGGLIYKLILAPLIIYVLYFLILGKRGIPYEISVLECAMPPMITASILATKYKLDEQLANYLPTLGIIASVVTLLFWKWLM